MKDLDSFFTKEQALKNSKDHEFIDYLLNQLYLYADLSR